MIKYNKEEILRRVNSLTKKEKVALWSSTGSDGMEPEDVVDCLIEWGWFSPDHIGMILKLYL